MEILEPSGSLKRRTARTVCEQGRQGCDVRASTSCQVLKLASCVHEVPHAFW